MNSNDEAVARMVDTRLVATTTGAINAFCRVVELHLKAIQEGASPELSGPLGETVKMAAKGLQREVEFLTFLREGGAAMALERDSPAET